MITSIATIIPVPAPEWRRRVMTSSPSRVVDDHVERAAVVGDHRDCLGTWSCVVSSSAPASRSFDPAAAASAIWRTLGTMLRAADSTPCSR